ncbi:hypothetical protein [Antribacter gilvus]|uniref:hypothetical protein n=1 Tax=Antribacter gilvus TaxID=2304675 RepID=UPI000F797FBF|nr:hypothetical protein [Antribacter gilvus]
MGTTTLADSAEAASTLLAELGDDRVKCVEVYRDRLMVHPLRLPDGASLAEALSLPHYLDVPGTTPGYSMWRGAWNGWDVHVFGELRTPAGAVAVGRGVRSWPV